MLRTVRHPFRGAVSGLIIGTASVLLMVFYGLYKAENLVLACVIVGAFILLGVLLGLFGPARGKSG